MSPRHGVLSTVLRWFWPMRPPSTTVWRSGRVTCVWRVRVDWSAGMTRAADDARVADERAHLELDVEEQVEVVGDVRARSCSVVPASSKPSKPPVWMPVPVVVVVVVACSSLTLISASSLSAVTRLGQLEDAALA